MASLNELLHEVRRIEEHRVVLTEKKIKSIYRSLYKDLNAFISDEYVKYADKDGKLFLSYLDSQNKRAKFLQEIATRVDGISSEVKNELLEMVDATYEKSYRGMVKAVLSADETAELDLPKSLVRPEVLKSAVKNNIEKLTLPAVMEKHRAEIVADIQQTLNIGLMNGDRFETMAKRVQERLGVSYSKASNIARTESHRNIESGLLDGAKETSSIIEKDNDLIYAATWKTMDDQRVRPQVRRKTKKGWKTTYSNNGANHVKMHGVTIKVGEKFQLETGVYAECPGMSGTARNDCRCRCYLSYALMTVAEFAKATKQTEEEVRKKYKMVENDQRDSSENPLKNEENYGRITTPKSLQNFDSHQQEWADNAYTYTDAERKKLESNISKVIESNAYAMRVNTENLQSIIDGGFKNQFETGTSGGTLNVTTRRRACKKLFDADVDNMANADFEKYGYLGSFDFALDEATTRAKPYGRTIVRFNKDKLADRVTYTIDDSLANGLFDEVVGGKIGGGCSISGIPSCMSEEIMDVFDSLKEADFVNPDKIAQKMKARYWELQYHGDLTIDDVESICFTRGDLPTQDVLEQLKKHGVKTYELKGDAVNEI